MFNITQIDLIRLCCKGSFFSKLRSRRSSIPSHPETRQDNVKAITGRKLFIGAEQWGDCLENRVKCLPKSDIILHLNDYLPISVHAAYSYVVYKSLGHLVNDIIRDISPRLVSWRSSRDLLGSPWPAWFQYPTCTKKEIQQSSY